MSKKLISIALEKEDWEDIMTCLLLSENDETELINHIKNKVSRSENKPPEATVLCPIEFAGVHGKMICISSKEREPIEQLLPILKGNILIFTSYSPNMSGIESARKKGHDKNIVIKKIQSLVMIQILLKRKDLTENLDTIIVDRIDEIDNGKNKRDKGAIMAGMLSILPSLVGDVNVFFTTMYGLNGLYERVDIHRVV